MQAQRFFEVGKTGLQHGLSEELVKKEIVDAANEYRRSADMLNVKLWTGLKGVVFPVLTSVIGSIIHLDGPALAAAIGRTKNAHDIAPRLGRAFLLAG